MALFIFILSKIMIFCDNINKVNTSCDRLTEVYFYSIKKKHYIKFKISKKSYIKKNIIINLIINNEAEYLADVLIGETLYDKSEMELCKKTLLILDSVNLDIVLVGGENNV
jgi:hypothetical protein